MIKVVMYTGNNCSKCKRAKAMLESCPVEVEIEELNVDDDKRHLEVLTLVRDSHTLPTFVFPNGKIVRGFDENIGVIMEELGL